MTGKKISEGFSTRATGNTESVLGASLGLFAADTRGGISPVVQAHLKTVEAAGRTDYARKYRDASGHGATAGAAAGNRLGGGGTF